MCVCGGGEEPLFVAYGIAYAQIMENSMGFSEKKKALKKIFSLSYHSAVSKLFSKELVSYKRDTYTSMFIAAVCYSKKLEPR